MSTQEEVLEKIVNQMHTKAAEAYKNQGVMTLGELIDALKAITRTHHNNGDEREVIYDFLGHVPTTLGSWRGIYSELALGVGGYDDAPTLSELITRCESAVGETFEGWKGGKYTMSRNTNVHVANRGETWSTGVIGVLDSDYQVVILTGYIA